MRLLMSALVAATTMGAAAWAQTDDEAPAEGTAPAEGVAEDGTPLLLPGQDEDTIETDVTATDEGLEMDGTVPVDETPEPEETATTEIEGGASGGEAVGEGTADVPTDVTAEGEALRMDGTVPVDETPEAEGD